MLTTWHGPDRARVSSWWGWPPPGPPRPGPRWVRGQFSSWAMRGRDHPALPCLGHPGPGWNLRSLHNYSLKTAQTIPSFWGTFQLYPLKPDGSPNMKRPMTGGGCIFISFILAEQARVSYRLHCQQRDLIFTSFTIFWTNSWPGRQFVQ